MAVFGEIGIDCVGRGSVISIGASKPAANSWSAAETAFVLAGSGAVSVHELSAGEALMEPRIMLARLFMLGAMATGVIGLAAGLSDKAWKLGATGWFTGGTLLAVLSLVVLADHYFESKGQSG